MYKISLNIKKYASISIFTEFESIKNKFLNSSSSIKKTLPITDIKISEVEEVENKDSIIINDSKLLNMSYDVFKNCAILYIDEKNIRVVDLVYISLSMFSNILQNNNKYLVHSSVVKINDNNAIMIVGDANAGKTSLAFKLMQDYNYKLISNDHAVVGFEENEMKVYGGTKEIQMRIGALQMYFPDLYNKIINDIKLDNIWEQRLIINKYINQEQITNEDNEFCKITDIYNLSSYREGDTFLRKKDTIDQKLFLYESISKQIKGTYNLITTFNYPMPSVENIETLKQLVNNCNSVIYNNNINVFEGKGTLDELCKKMVKK